MTAPYIAAVALLALTCLLAYLALRPGPAIPPTPQPGRHRADGLDDETKPVIRATARPMWPTP